MSPPRAALSALALAAALLGATARADPPPSPGARAILAGELPALGTTVPELGELPSAELLGKPIRRVEVLTVGGRWPSSPAVASVKAGEPLSLETARRAMREVLSTARYARANVEGYAEGDGVVVRVNVLPRRLIATIKVTGGALETPETLDAAEVAVGGELTAPLLEEIALRIQRFYEKHGYPSTQTRVDTTDTDQPDKVVLSIEITPGKPRTVTERVMVVDPRSDKKVGELKDRYKIAKGARADETALAEADRDLGEVLKQHGFFRADVRHALRSVGASSTLYVYVISGPRLVPTFTGNRAFDGDQLEAALGLDKTPDSREAELVDRLKTFYVARGFYDAEVKMTERGEPDDAVHYLAFAIRENQRVRVVRRVFPCLTGELSPDEMGREIGSFLEEELPGADTFTPGDPREIARLFGPTQGTGGRGLALDLNPGMTYAPETYDRAVKHLRDLLHSKGYLNAVVGPLTVMRAACSKRSPPGQCLPIEPREKVQARCLKDSLGLPLPEPPVPEAYTCHPDPKRDLECSPDLTLRIPIALGPQTTLWDLAFEGNRSIDDKELAKIADLPLGTPLSNVELEAARLRVVDAYRLRGFAYADVRAAAEPSPDRTRARVRFGVVERDRVMVADFVVRGAARTNEALILRRVALKRGQPYRSDWARQTEERIATLGTFSSVSVALEDADIPQRRKRVVITVIELPSQYIEPQIGFSTGDGVRFAFEYGHRNLGGQAISLTLRVQLSYLFDFLILDDAVRENYAKLSALDRLERRNTASVTFREIGLGPLVSLSLDGIDLRDNQRDFAITKEAFVPTLTYRPLKALTTQLSLSAERNDVAIFNEKALADTFTLLRAPEGETVAVAERLGLITDFRDNPFNATRGVLFSTALEHVNAFPLPGIDNKATITSHFLRFTGRVAGYVRLTQKGTTLALSLSAGYNLQLDGQSKTYPDRLFFLGGVDTIRAFLADAVVPQDVADLIQNKKYNAATKHAWTIDDVALRGGDLAVNPRVELRVPLTGIFQTGIFLDTGNLWLDPSLFDITSLRYALGAGLRIGTPIGPLALDYGINLNRRPWEDFGAFHFSIGLF